MIVKDEEHSLKQCLVRLKGKVEEVIIVDTGSIDRTKELALEFTDKVYDFEWCNDFSKARNFAISKASFDWILVLDADEEVVDFDKKKVEEFTTSNEEVVGRIKRINIFEDSHGDKRHIERVNRLFNKNFYYYSGSIHEQVTSIKGKVYETSEIDIMAEHNGYSREVINRTSKLERNISMLITAINDNNKDPYLFYQLGKSYFMSKDYLKACEQFVLSLGLQTDFNLEYVIDLVNSYGYALLNSERYSEAMGIKKYEKLYGHMVDFQFLLGNVYMNNGEFTDAVESFTKCLKLKEGSIEGIDSYLSNYNLGVIFECCGKIKEAINFYKKCGKYAPANVRLNILEK